MAGDNTSKATTEIRCSIDEETDWSRIRAIDVGVDPTKILIGPVDGGVMAEVAVCTVVGAVGKV